MRLTGSVIAVRVITVDTSEAGNGDIEVLVTYDARQMATRVSRAGHVYHVSFMPEGPGVYNIEVHFADMEVQGLIVMQNFVSFKLRREISVGPVSYVFRQLFILTYLRLTITIVAAKCLNSKVVATFIATSLAISLMSRPM